MPRNKPRKRRAFGRLERLPSGRYRAAYMGPDGWLTRAPQTFDAQDDAVAWLAARRAEIQMELWAPELAARVSKVVGHADAQSVWRRMAGRPQDQGATVAPHHPAAVPHGPRPVRLPGVGDTRIDQITAEDIDQWYDALAPGGRRSERMRTACCERSSPVPPPSRPYPLIAYNPAHIRGAGTTKRAHRVEPATLDELEVIVGELPGRYKLMALLAVACPEVR